MSGKHEPAMRLKLLIDTRANCVLFAEAGKDFVDFLFSLMSLPIGTVVRLLSSDDMVGSLGKVYKSIETLGEAYVESGSAKTALLNPDNAVVYKGAAKLLSLSKVANVTQTFHNVPYSLMSYEVSKPSSSSHGENGYVKECVTYMVMDDLEVKPISTISTLALINKYGIREMGDLQERVVSIGMKEGLKLLKASLESKTVLTNVFLGRQSSVVAA